MAGETIKNADLKTLIQSLGLSATEFSRAIQVPKSNLSEMISNKRSISKGVMLKIRKKYPQVSMSWLITGEGEMFLNRELKTQNDNGAPIASLKECRDRNAELERQVKELKAEIYDLQKLLLHD